MLSLSFLFLLCDLLPSLSVLNLFLDHFFQFLICIFFNAGSDLSALTSFWIVLWRERRVTVVYFSFKSLFAAKEIIESDIL